MAHINPLWPSANSTGWDVQMNGSLGTVVSQVNTHDDAIAVLNFVPSSLQTGSTYTFTGADAGTVVEGNSAGAQIFTVPPTSTASWTVGSVIEVYQLGAGQITLAAGAGVTLQNPSSLKVRVQFGTVSLRYRGNDIWAVSGDLV